MLVNVPRLMTAYYTGRPDLAEPGQRVAFGTSGHRGSSLDNSFNERHILAITQAICDYRQQQPSPARSSSAPTPMRSPTPPWPAPSRCSRRTTERMIDDRHGYTPTPVVSHAILTYNRSAPTRSSRRDRHHSVPQPTRGRRLQVQPAQRRPRRHPGHQLDSGPRQRVLAEASSGQAHALRAARRAATTRRHDYIDAYIDDLANVIDMDALRGAGLKLGVDPMGGAGRPVLGHASPNTTTFRSPSSATTWIPPSAS